MPVRTKIMAVGMLATMVAGCADTGVSSDVYDPLEPMNRGVHEFNKSVDKIVLRPSSKAYGTIIPEPVRNRFSDLSTHLSTPSAIVNDVLQANFVDAMHNTSRFLVNTVFGLGGLFDPATAGGVEFRDSDFGETLHVWGVGEGAYVELPFFGPSTTRDTVGLVVDYTTDPVGAVLEYPEAYIVPIAYVLALMGDRYKFEATFDSVLYDSADSYAQSRLLYLENRRFELGIEQDEEEVYEDLYEGLYDDFGFE